MTAILQVGKYSLFLGNEDDANDLMLLNEHDVRAVVNCTGNVFTKAFRGIEYVKAPVANTRRMPDSQLQPLNITLKSAH